jgi:hypothetical protein
MWSPSEAGDRGDGRAGDKTRGKPTSAGTVPTAGGAVKRNASGISGSRGDGDPAWDRPRRPPFGYAGTAAGRGRSSTNGSEEHSRGWSRARPVVWSGGARRLGARVGRPRCSGICPTTFRGPVCRVGTGRFEDGDDPHPPAAPRTHEGTYLIDLTDCCFRYPRVRLGYQP